MPPVYSPRRRPLAVYGNIQPAIFQWRECASDAGSQKISHVATDATWRASAKVHYKALAQLLDGFPSVESEVFARRGLRDLSTQQLKELSTGIYDFIDKGGNSSVNTVPFISNWEKLHMWGDQAQQMLVVVPTLRDLSLDLFYELEHRFPEFKFEKFHSPKSPKQDLRLLPEEKKRPRPLKRSRPSTSSNTSQTTGCASPPIKRKILKSEKNNRKTGHHYVSDRDAANTEDEFVWPIMTGALCSSPLQSGVPFPAQKYPPCDLLRSQSTDVERGEQLSRKHNKGHDTKSDGNIPENFYCTIQVKTEVSTEFKAENLTAPEGSSQPTAYECPLDIVLKYSSSPHVLPASSTTGDCVGPEDAGDAWSALKPYLEAQSESLCAIHVVLTSGRVENSGALLDEQLSQIVDILESVGFVCGDSVPFGGQFILRELKKHSDSLISMRSSLDQAAKDATVEETRQNAVDVSASVGNNVMKLMKLRPITE